MSGKSRLIVRLALLLLSLNLTACAGSFVKYETASISTETVMAQLQFVDGPTVGPLYNIEVTVPADWVGQFETRNLGNKLYFEFVTESGTPAKIFFIEALSASQYWEQNGAHPGSYTNIVNRGDTFFIYHLPIDAYYSGLSEADFMVFAEAVPGIVASFNASVTN